MWRGQTRRHVGLPFCLARRRCLWNRLRRPSIVEGSRPIHPTGRRKWLSPMQRQGHCTIKYFRRQCAISVEMLWHAAVLPHTPGETVMKLRRSAVGALFLLATCSGKTNRAAPLALAALSRPTRLWVWCPLPRSPPGNWSALRRRRPLPGAICSRPPLDESRKVLMMFRRYVPRSQHPDISASPELVGVEPPRPAYGPTAARLPPGDKPLPSCRRGAWSSTRSATSWLSSEGARPRSATTPTSGTGILATDSSSAPTRTVGPSPRSQHGMVFEKSTGNVLLFGGGVACAGSAGRRRPDQRVGRV